MEHRKTIARPALHFFFGTFLSRISGMLRDIVMAFCFGTSPAIAAFMVAFRFANLLRRLFGEGSLSAGFIPHFESIRKEDPHKASCFFRDFLASLTCLAIFCTIILEFVVFGLLKWEKISPDFISILSLTMWMMPGFVFICAYAICSAFLQCEKKFFVIGAAPIAFNAAWIICALLFKNKGAEYAVIPLALAIVAGFLLQWSITLPGVISSLKTFFRLRDFLSASLFSNEVKKILRPLFLSVMGVGAVQINSALDAVFARFASLEGPAYLWYAIRLQQLPVALFGIALSSALLPALSRSAQAEDMHQFRFLLNFSLKKSFSIIFPCMVGIFVWGAAAVNLIFGRGGFTDRALTETSVCLWAYAAGLVPAIFVLLLAPAMYARKNYRSPMLFSFSAVVLNVVLNAMMVFIFQWGAFSVAIATSICAFFNCGLLIRSVSKKTGPILNSEMKSSFAKTMVCSCFAGMTAFFLSHFILQDPTLSILLGRGDAVFVHRFAKQLLQFAVPFSLFIGCLFLFARLTQAEDILNLVKGLKKNIDSSV